jgi:hypothetical protein
MKPVAPDVRNCVLVPFRCPSFKHQSILADWYHLLPTGAKTRLALRFTTHGELISMIPTVPAIYARNVERPPLAMWARLAALALALACLGVLVTAARLTPNPAGVGTHSGMGLEGCRFLKRTGVPCPSCGMTTSFAWLVRGNLVASVYVQPMGAALALLTCVAFWVCLHIAITGHALHQVFGMIPGRYVVAPLLVLAVLAWAWKVFTHIGQRGGWG